MIFDLHNDLLTSDLNSGGMHGYIHANHDNIITLAYWTSHEAQPFLKLLEFIAEFKVYENIRFAVEDIGFLTDEILADFLKLPLLYCTLVWKDENIIAGGHNTDCGLTAYGKKTIKRLSDAGIKIDTAHLSERAFYEAVDIVPEIFNSHCCLKSINPHTRNLSGNQVREIINRQGIIGLTVVDDFFGEEKGIDGYIRQIDTFVQKFGCDSLSIGTDFYGTDSIEGLASYKDFDNLKYRLQNLGYKSSEIDKIYFQNADSYFGNAYKNLHYPNTVEI